MTDRELMQQALEAFEWNYNTDLDNIPACEQWAKMLKENITALRAALAEPEQEPVAWELRMGKTDRVLMEITNNPERAQNWRASLCEVVPLYYAPTPRKPLTDESVKTIWDSGMKYAPGEMRVLAFARALEKAHGIGEQT